MKVKAQEQKPKLTRSEAGRLGGLVRASLPPEVRPEISKKAVAKRKANNPNAFREMGAKGGMVSRGGGRKKGVKVKRNSNA